MRILLVLLSVISFNFISAQPGGGGGQRGGGQGMGPGGQQKERPEIREFDASEIVGVFNYNTDEGLKKMKFKKTEGELKLDVQRAIVNHNNKVNEIALLNKDNFDTLNVFVNKMMKASRPNKRHTEGEQSNQKGAGMDSSKSKSNSEEAKSNAKELVEQKINPARIGIRTAERKLNKKLKSLLSEKRYEKWLKYQKRVKDDLKPEKELEQNNNEMTGGRRQGGGPSGGGMR